MDNIQVTTNNVPRDLFCPCEVPAHIYADFDYIDFDDGPRLFKYRRQWYDICEFMKAPEVLGDWQGYQSETHFSGIVVKYAEGMERVIVGAYYAP